MSPAPAAAGQGRRTLILGFFGTSIMEHLEAFNTRLTNQSNLPEVGSVVLVEGWRQRGWVHRLALSLRADWPQVTFDIRNHGRGGATSRDILGIVETDRSTTQVDYDLALVSCGINDVWRRFQNRTAEAVDLAEYTSNLATVLRRLGQYTRQLLVLSETPFGPIDAAEIVDRMNTELAQYNAAAADVAATHGVPFLDLWKPFNTAARHLAGTAVEPSTGLWSDGVHLSDLGDTLLLHQTERFLAAHGTIASLID